MKRRQFLASSALVAGVPLLAHGAPAELITRTLEELLQNTQAGQALSPDSFTPADQDSFLYWLYRNRNPNMDLPSRQAGGEVGIYRSRSAGEAVQAIARSRPRMGGEELIPRVPMIGGREPKFVAYTPDKGFRLATELPDSELVEKGDVDVTVLVNTLRPSLEDAGTMADAVGGSLRLDCGQQNKTPLPPLENALAWSAIGVLAATSLGKKLPKVDSLKFDNKKGMLFGTAQTIPLVGGLGHWEWSFYVQKKESTWLKALKFIGGLTHVAGASTPGIFSGLGLPAIAWAALTSVDGLYAYLHAKEVESDWLFQGVQSDIAATQETKRLGRILLRKGTTQYLVVPSSHTAKLVDRNDVKVSNNGFVVPKSVENNLGAQEAATTTLTDVTYVSLTLEVQSRPKKSP